MAPWPEQGSEPKAPDKEEKRDLVEASKKIELDDNSQGVISRIDQKQTDEKEFSSLDDGQLRALLDEAITYKNPKDREGKSELFKELLQEAEADESDNKGLGSSLSGKLPRGYYNLPVRRRHTRHQGRECGVGVSTTRGGSLQNLHALGMEGTRSNRTRKNGRSGEPLVSARQHEGGSLPTNVNVDNDSELDGIICANYTSRATLEVSGTGKEDNVSPEDSNALTLYKVQGHYIPNGTEQVSTKEDEPVCTSYASSICVGPVESGAMLYPPSPVQHVSVLSIPPPQIHIGPDEHRNSDSSEHKKLNISRNRHRKALIPPRSDPPPEDEVELTREELLGLPLTAYWNRYSSFTLLDFQDTGSRVAFGNANDGKAKSLDENGNALSCVKMDSNCLDRKKQRRVKTKNDRNTILSDDIEGFRGGADIDALMEYIESPSSVLDGTKTSKNRTNQANGPRNNVKVRAKEEDSRSIKRRSKEKFQRCNSLEEISKTKLEDLTEESSSERVNGSGHALAKKQVTLDDAELGKKSSWDDGDSYMDNTVIKKKDPKVDRASSEGVQDSEFHVVTKKQRKKKRRSGCSSRGVSKPVYYGSRGFPAHDRTLERDGSSNLLYQYRHGHSDQSGSQPRRKSAFSVPPSDKSDSSDLDSVHSLPVSSTTTRTKIGKNSVSGGSTPQASYADIARTVASPPDTSSQGKYSPYYSCARHDFEKSSTELPSETLPNSSASSSLKKDAMTEKKCDTTRTLPNEEYPPLDMKITDLNIDTTTKHTRSASRDSVDDKVIPPKIVIPVSDSGNVDPQSIFVDLPPCVKSPTNTNNKRPPVILMHEPMVSSQVSSELTFGFEVNQQLLRCDDLLRSARAIVSTSVVTSLSSTSPSTEMDSSLRRLIQFVSSAWEDALADIRNGKAAYYDGQ